MTAPYYAQYTDLSNRYNQANVWQMATHTPSDSPNGVADIGNTATGTGARVNLALRNADSWINGFLRSSTYSGRLPTLVDNDGNIPLELTDIAVKYAGWWLLASKGFRDFDAAGKPLNHLYADKQDAEALMKLIAEKTHFLMDVT